MLEFENRTPFVGAIFPGTDKNCRDFLSVVVKGSFSWDRPGADPVPAEEQQQLVLGDLNHGEPGVSSVKYESEAGPVKPATDVILLGHAQSPKGRQKELEVTLRVGSLSHTVRVFGDRKWSRTLGMWKLSDPEPFDRMPLVYERAFGGADVKDPDPDKQGLEKRNPVGTGFAVNKDSLEDMPGPNLEDPKDLLKGWKDRPEPVGFGYLGRGWSPRVEKAGTYDETWSSDRAPLLPVDFDEAFFNGAHPRLTATPKLRGGEPVLLQGASVVSDLRFDLPARVLEARWVVKDVWTTAPMELDTVILEPDESRVQMIWRANIPCGRDMMAIDKVIAIGGE